MSAPPGDAFRSERGRAGIAHAIPWREVARRAPSVADAVSSLVTRYRFAFAGTIRRDGTPRISTVETHIVLGELVIPLLPGTRKASDLRRDPRITLQSPVLDAFDPGAEYKLRGRVCPARRTGRGRRRRGREDERLVTSGGVARRYRNRGCDPYRLGTGRSRPDDEVGTDARGSGQGSSRA
jgi:hypothetical protein